jgi:hypothetical protein
MTPQEVCEAALRPNDPNSEFLTEPMNEIDNVVLETHNVVDAEFYDQVGTGTPSYDDYSDFDSSYHRNGGSPNVWTGATASTILYPSSDLLYHTTDVQTLGSTFDCKVWKDPGGPDHGPDEIDPNGLQSYGNSTVTGTNEIPGADYTDHNGGPFSEGTSYYDANVLICISPDSTTKGKPGDWRNMHGFGGSCSAANTAAGGTVPSGNDPA